MERAGNRQQSDPDDEVAELRQRLAVAELRLREAQHRAVSGAAAVSKILAQQAGQLRDPVARAALETAHERMTALADMHRMLLPALADTPVDMRKVVQNLCTVLGKAMDAAGRGITIRSTVTGAMLPPGTAAPLSLITNELIANALRYAFRGRSHGLVDVTLRMTEGRIHLCVADDGIGISEKTLQRQDTGLWLMRQLVSEIGGILEVERVVGTRATVLAPMPRQSGTAG